MISFAQRFTLPLAILSLALLAGCGNSNNNPPANPEGFTNSNLTGTYVFFSARLRRQRKPLEPGGRFRC